MGNFKIERYLFGKDNFATNLSLQFQVKSFDKNKKYSIFFKIISQYLQKIIQEYNINYHEIFDSYVRKEQKRIATSIFFYNSLKNLTS